MFKPVNPAINFPEMERKILDYWYKNGIVEKYLVKNQKSTKRFSFLDGPITANNPMGVHHGWGRTYKDLWQRFFNMKGYKQRFQNGFDCQGLWIEVEVEKELGITNKKQIENLTPGNRIASIAKFVELCKERVYKFSKIQTEQTKRLGNFMDWDNSYFTLSDENNYMIWHFLKTCHANGWIYKGKDSVPWCPRCQTAISQHEMLTEDYKELTHETVFIKLRTKNIEPRTKNLELRNKIKEIYMLFWTTTPWTVPANVAVGVNTKFTYGIWQKEETNEAIIFIDKDELGNIPKRIHKGKEIAISEYILSATSGEYRKIGQLKGSDLLGLQYEAPFDDLPIVKKARSENPQKFHRIVDGSEIVVATEGTGLLHIAPGAGKEDFDIGKKEQLPIISPIDDEAIYVDGLAEFSGKNAKKHPEIIIDFLKSYENGTYLFKTMQYTHRYPVCWRCKTELVWKVAEEWYVAMDRKLETKNQELRTEKRELTKNQELRTKNKTLRERMMGVAKKINWIPDFGLERELDWLKNMHDWLISKKNRYWGLALPIYECKHCGWFDIIGSYGELKNRSISGWSSFEGKSPHKPYIDEVKIKCQKCDMEVSRIPDVGNVWLDAGIVPYSTYIHPVTKKLSYTTDKTYWEAWFPPDFITESFPGQFKNWFYSMIAMSTVLENSPPFKTVLGFASVLGEDGRPMHKSWGNAIEFNEGADKIGVDVMRWLYTLQTPTENLLFGFKKADETRRKFHLLLWNIYNFFITYSNIDGWEPTQNQELSTKNINVLDQWIISRLNNVIIQVTDSLENYNASNAAVLIESFVTDLSQWYIRRSRDRVGPTATDTLDKNNCYYTLSKVLLTLCKLLAPFIPYLSEEIFRNLTSRVSVHLENWPEIEKQFVNNTLEKQMQLGRKLVELGHSLRKEHKIKTRQPLAVAWLQEKADVILEKKVLDLVLAELNIKSWVLKDKSKAFVSQNAVVSKEIEGIKIFIDLTITENLKEEGQAREIVRNIQMLRKELGFNLTDKARVTLDTWPQAFTEYIKKEALVEKLIKGNTVKVEKA